MIIITQDLKTYHDLAIIEAAKDRLERCNYWEFFIENALRIPHVFEGAKEAALLAPSSGASERVLSFYSTTFTSSSHSSLEDLREASIMIQYNDSMRNRRAVNFECDDFDTSEGF